ncbi:MAG: multiple sugar transport system permease protein [Chloroflexia bacterium]|nr:multiple sugar transport system permease protein [Chloroflexia bacterium]
MSLPAVQRSKAGSPAGRLPQVSYKRQLGLMLAPYVLGLLGLVLLPALLSIPFAFTDYNALRAPNWIGFDNFREMFGDWLFWNGLGASLFYIVLAVPLRVLGAVFLAFLLHKPTVSNKINRVIAYLPTLIPDVAYALLWLYIFNPLYGPLNWILRLLGARTESWLLEPWPAKFAIVIMMLWPIGEGFVLMLAAFHQIPQELSEAGQVDGASGRQRFLHITLPLLAPAILLLVFRDTVFSFQANFVPGLITTGGGPYHATRFLPIYVWQNAAEYQRFGYAAAMTWVMYGITVVIVTLQFVVARRWRNLLSD